MGWRSQTVLLASAGATVMVLLTGVANARPDPKQLMELHQTIATVKTNAPSRLRTEAAEHLAEITRGIDPNAVDDKTLADLVSLLDTWDDSVRVPVAVSLGNVGPRAKVAARELLEMLPDFDCLWVDVPPAPIIRQALTRMGVTPPPPPTCETTVDPVAWNQRMKEMIAKARTGESSTARAKAAGRLSYLAFWLGPKRIDDATVADLVSLLDVPDEPVREAVVPCLEFLGPRARVAIPKLEQLLPEVDCDPLSLRSAEAIRSALERMGVKPLAPTCGKSG